MPARRPRRVYWDTRVWVALVDPNAQPEKHDIARRLYLDASKGRIIIATSAFTRAECRKLRGHRTLTRAEQETLNKYFYPEYIERINIDWVIAERAAEFGERYNLDPPDATHLATAADPRWEVDAFQSWDSDFFKPSVLKNNPPLPIEEPR